MPIRKRRPAGARPHGRQFLRRDRAGRVLHAEHRARHRLHQRPAAAGPQLLLSRHAAEAAGRPELHPSAGQRAEVPVRTLPAGRPHGDAQPKGRANYEPNSWGGAAGGPREDRRARVPHLRRRPRAAQKLRVRAELFADHYSQARQFYVSQTPVEQTHINDAFVFELSKVETPAIRARDGRATSERRRGPGAAVADGLGLERAAEAGGRRRASRSPTCRRRRRSASSQNGPNSFEGPQARRAGHRRRGRRAARRRCAGRRGRGRDGRARSPRRSAASPPATARSCRRSRRSTAARRCCTTPSRCSPSAEGAALLANEATAKDFVTDAFAHASSSATSRCAKPSSSARRVWCPTTGSSASMKRTVSHSSSALRPISACGTRDTRPPDIGRLRVAAKTPAAIAGGWRHLCSCMRSRSRRATA